MSRSTRPADGFRFLRRCEWSGLTAGEKLALLLCLPYECEWNEAVLTFTPRLREKIGKAE